MASSRFHLTLVPTPPPSRMLGTSTPGSWHGKGLERSVAFTRYDGKADEPQSMPALSAMCLPGKGRPLAGGPGSQPVVEEEGRRGGSGA